MLVSLVSAALCVLSGPQGEDVWMDYVSLTNCLSKDGYWKKRKLPWMAIF